jgi:hypothetical protein
LPITTQRLFFSWGMVIHGSWSRVLKIVSLVISDAHILIFRKSFFPLQHRGKIFATIIAKVLKPQTFHCTQKWKCLMQHMPRNQFTQWEDDSGISFHIQKSNISYNLYSKRKQKFWQKSLVFKGTGSKSFEILSY